MSRRSPHSAAPVLGIAVKTHTAAHKPERAREAHYKTKKSKKLKCCNAPAPVPAARTCGSLDGEPAAAGAGGRTAKLVSASVVLDHTEN